MEMLSNWKKNSQMNEAKIDIAYISNTQKVPSYLIEVAYFVLLVYANLGPAYGLAIPLAGAGTLAGLAFLCGLHFGIHIVGAFRPIKFALGLAISVFLIQELVFEEPLRDGPIRYFITWILSLVIIQSLSYRKGFFHRFAIVAFCIGCATLPFLKVYVGNEEMIRIGGERGVALANPNYFGMWFGFCAVYFLIAGLEAKNYIIRSASWLVGLFCLYLMGISVSRGALLGVAIAMVIAFEKVLKRSFLPILGFLCFGWLVYVSGIFDDLIGYYLHRGAEETGRSRLWAWAFDGILNSWGGGVGFSEAMITDGITGKSYGPHNSFLFIALSSGILSLSFYVAYLGQVIRGGLRARLQNAVDSPFILPLVSYSMLSLMVADEVFMSPWHMVVFCAAIGVSTVGRKRKKPDLQNRRTKNFRNEAEPSLV